MVCFEGDCVVVKYLYVGCCVMLFDFYLCEVDGLQCDYVVIDWGFVIKELVVVNIFVGDMVFKNFGVMWYGCVVFYDYDELCLFRDCCFCLFFEVWDDDCEFVVEFWFIVCEGDVFFMELRIFFGFLGEVCVCFEYYYVDFYEVGFWCDLQECNECGEVVDFYLYSVC